MSLAVVTEVAMSFIVYELWFYQIPAQQYIFRNFKAHIIQLMPIFKTSQTHACTLFTVVMCET